MMRLEQEFREIMSGYEGRFSFGLRQVSFHGFVRGRGEFRVSLEEGANGGLSLFADGKGEGCVSRIADEDALRSEIAWIAEWLGLERRKPEQLKLW